MMWSKGKADTENGHNQIIKLLQQWSQL
jgi:hypothetical protein